MLSLSARSALSSSRSSTPGVTGQLSCSHHYAINRSRRSRSFSWITAAAVGVSVFAMLPLGFIVWIAIQSGWETVAALVFRPRVAALLLNSILLVVCTVPLCALLALALAWLTERSLLPAARWWSWLMIAPLAVPAFVQSYAWITILPGLKGLSGAVLVSVLAYFPFMYLPLSSALRQLDPSMEDVAASLGYSRWQVWIKVVLPQLRLALCGGGLLVGLHLLAEYGLFVMIRFDTFTTAIIDQFQSSYNGPAANLLGGLLVLCCMGLLALDNFLRGGARYARVGSGAARLTQPAGNPQRWWRILLCLLPLGTGLLALGVPFWTLGRWLVAGGSAIWRLDELLPATFQTFYLAFGGALITTLVALPMAWLSVRAPSRLQRLLEGSNYVVGALPGVVIALCLVTLTVRLPIYQTGLTAILAYVLLFLPRALLSLRTGISQAPVELEQVARSLGRTPANAIWSVTMRIAAPNAAAGAALVLLGITNELTATLMLAPNGTQTLAMMFWSYSSEIDYAAAAPYALIMVLLSLPMTWLLYLQSKRSAGR